MRQSIRWTPRATCTSRRYPDLGWTSTRSTSATTWSIRRLLANAVTTNSLREKGLLTLRNLLVSTTCCHEISLRGDAWASAKRYLPMATASCHEICRGETSKSELVASIERGYRGEAVAHGLQAGDDRRQGRAVARLDAYVHHIDRVRAGQT